MSVLLLDEICSFWKPWIFSWDMAPWQIYWLYHVMGHGLETFPGIPSNRKNGRLKRKSFWPLDHMDKNVQWGKFFVDPLSTSYHSICWDHMIHQDDICSFSNSTNFCFHPFTISIRKSSTKVAINLGDELCNQLVVLSDKYFESPNHCPHKEWLRRKEHRRAFLLGAPTNLWPP